MNETAASNPEWVTAGDPEVDEPYVSRPRWVVLLIVVPLFVAAGFLFTGGQRLERSEAPLPGFEVQSTTTTVGFTADLSVGWSALQAGAWGRFVDVLAVSGHLMAVEQSPDGSRLWNSPDAAQWDPVPGTEDVFAGAWIEEIIETKSELVAVGFTGAQSVGRKPAVWLSTDGVTWEWVAIPTLEALGYGVGEEGRINTVIESKDGMLVAAGVSQRGATIWYSTDGGVSWAIGHREGFISEVHSLNLRGDGFLAIGSVAFRPGLWASADGVSWVRDDETPIVAAESFEFPWTLLEVGSEWLAIGGDRSDQRAEFRGRGWERRPPVIWTSSDGVEWNRDLIDELEGVQFNSVLEGGPGLIAAGVAGGSDSRAGIWWNSGGPRWDGVLIEEATGTTQLVSDMTMFGDRIVVVGQAGAGPALWVWDPERPVALASSVELPYFEGRWVDRGWIADAHLWQVSKVEDGYLATAEQSIWHSTDLVDWESQTFEESGSDGMQWVGEITGDRAPYFLTGWSMDERWTILRSDDGRAWSTVWQAESGSGGRIASNSGRLLRAFDESWSPGWDVASSIDGITWNEIERPPVDGFITGISGFRDSFFAIFTPSEGGGESSMWRLGPDDSWTEVAGVRLGMAWDTRFFWSGDRFHMFIGCCEEAQLYATSDGVTWRSVELPAAGRDASINIAPVGSGLFFSVQTWSEEVEWPMRQWLSTDGESWAELPAIPGVDGWTINPIPSSEGLGVFELGEDGTRLWEWEPGDA
ncbi:MAG: hypothetical protein OEX97_06220 [Acidimicrobiia bacterium]|nr:hypothetical protein [Acidimicrobiia bacterium]